MSEKGFASAKTLDVHQQQNSRGKEIKTNAPTMRLKYRKLPFTTKANSPLHTEDHNGDYSLKTGSELVY